MITCVNIKCENLNQDMDETVVICPICGEKTEEVKTKLDSKKRMAPIISIAAIASILVTLMHSWFWFFLGIGILVACIVASIVIKSKAAIIVSVLSVFGLAAILMSYGFFDALL